ncbi:MAG: hypothetical protein VR74_01430 [Hyphomonas sp. BRH_c22]|nr:MAG: hypothetical protein VR74_01430 [Hyphomonas sp. BRH_c22]
MHPTTPPAQWLLALASFMRFSIAGPGIGGMPNQSKLRQATTCDGVTFEATAPAKFFTGRVPSKSVVL